MPIRNPFGRRSGVPLAQDENVLESNGPRLTVEPPGFERVDTVGSKASSLSTRSSKNNDTGAYKLSGMTLFGPRRGFLAELPRHSRLGTPAQCLSVPIADHQ